MNLDLNLIDGLRDFLDADRDNDAPGLRDVKWNVRDWVKVRMVEVWEQPDMYTLTVTDLLESLTQIEEFGTCSGLITSGARLDYIADSGLDYLRIDAPSG